ncbi:MAG: fluoroquinolone resistance protein [Verrucomicrobiales bacterium]|jgi:fluoroquinolone resistance protein
MNDATSSPFQPAADNVDQDYVDKKGTGPFRNLCFEACTFTRCHFERARFENVSFVDCRCVDSEFSMAELTETVFNGVVFDRCRMRGIDWTRINAGLLSIEFHECVLDFGNFEGLNLKKTPFLKCLIEEATFDGADLREAAFSNSKLTRSTFAHSDLRKADFRDTEDLALNLSECRCDGLKLRLLDARGTLKAHGVNVCA